MILRYQVVLSEKRKHVAVQQPLKDFPLYWKKWNRSIVFYWLLAFFMNRNSVGFFPILRKLPCSKQSLKISPKGFLIQSPQMFNLQVLILSWSWALLRSKPLSILPISLSVNVMFDKDLSVKSSEPVHFYSAPMNID